MNILILGGTGSIGQALTELLKIQLGMYMSLPEQKEKMYRTLHFYKECT